MNPRDHADRYVLSQIHHPDKSQGGIYAVIKLQGMLGHTTHADENPLHFKSE